MAKAAKKTAKAKPALPRKITGKAKSTGSFADIQAKAGQRKMVLHIGCGAPNPNKLHKSFRGDDWYEVRLDIDADARPDIVSDMLDMHMVPTGSVDAVWSSHNIEHLYPHTVPAALKEINRVIKPNGHFLVTLPDIQTVANYVAHGQLEEAIYDSPAGPICPIDIMYGLRSAMARGNLFMAHKTAYTAKSLGLHLKEAGFSNIKVTRDWVDLWAVGHKLDRNNPNFRDEIQIITTGKGDTPALPTPLPVNRTPHPGAMVAGKMPDELDVPPHQWVPVSL
tara:strand:+ start:544 stop:1380 length:837 start_codon:yes stop_codon:yes gene_type:complete